MTQVGSRYVTIEWEKSSYDGGSKLIGYNVEKRELPDGRWLKANYGNVSETHFKIDALTENVKYEFRVFAKNAIGKCLSSYSAQCILESTLLKTSLSRVCVRTVRAIFASPLPRRARAAKLRVRPVVARHPDR